MPIDISEIRSQHGSLTQAYETLMSELSADAVASAEEQAALARIAEKLAQVRERAEATAALAPEADGAAQNRKAGRLGRLRDMRSSMANMMASLKSAR